MNATVVKPPTRTDFRPPTRTDFRPPTPKVMRAAAVLACSLMVAACGASSGSSSTSPSPADPTAISAGAPDSAGPVLPVSSNPITNTSTVAALAIDSVLVENNADSSGTAVTDHLEIALANTGDSDLTTFEVFYTFADPTTGVSESYYSQLPAGFTIPAGGARVAHFDNTGAIDHFPVNEFSLYSTDTNALDVTVVVSAADAAVQTATIQKDAGGPETAD
jgi:hypothetical protein